MLIATKKEKLPIELKSTKYRSCECKKKKKKKPTKYKDSHLLKA